MNAIVVGVVALAVLAGVVFYFIQASESAGGQDDRESPSPTDETPEPSPTNETSPSPSPSPSPTNSTGNNTTSPTSSPDGNPSGGDGGSDSAGSFWNPSSWRVAPVVFAASTVSWAAVAQRPRIGGPRR